MSGIPQELNFAYLVETALYAWAINGTTFNRERPHRTADEILSDYKSAGRNLVYALKSNSSLRYSCRIIVITLQFLSP